MRNNLDHLKFKTCTFSVLMVVSVLNLQAQDYLISFAGSGGSTTVDKVKVENLTQGKSLEIDGGDALHLMGIVTGIETLRAKETGKIDFYPNPMKDFAGMQFDLPESGETLITMHDLSGKKIAQTRDLLQKGQHTYGIQDVKEGIYFIRINSGSYSFSGRLICSGSQNRGAKIEYKNTTATREKRSDSKGTNSETVMQYTTGDRLKITGISGIYSTVMTDVPSATKTITFNFIACTDGDGNNYPIVQIGTTKGTTDNLDPSEEKSVQTWMAENLKTTKYLNGDLIGTTTPASLNISGETTPKYQWAYNGNEANVTTYGRLYTWYAVTDSRNVCPTGWHVPDNNDWTALGTFLGGLNIAGGKLKEAGTTHWTTPNAGATNETGFTALPGGLRSYNGAYMFVGINGFWWSSTEYSSTNALNWDMDYRFIGLFWNYNLKPYGFSVRCVRD